MMLFLQLWCGTIDMEGTSDCNMDRRSTASRLNSGLTGRDHYKSTYSDSLRRQAEWFRRGACQKADAICKLLDQNGLKPLTILEAGCGTGAVIAELQRRGVAKSYYAMDYSEDAIAYVQETLPNVHSVAGDVMDCASLFRERTFDLVICSHVLEHLENPGQFLESLFGLEWKSFIAEVPLENLFFGKIRGILSDRGAHPAGHVQFFNRQNFLGLLSDAGMNVSDEYVYAPTLDRDTLDFAYGDGSRFRYLIKTCTEHHLPKRCGSLWTKFYHAHMAVLCRRIF